MIEMFGIDIGDDGNIGWQFQKRAVAFIGLDHHEVAGTEPRIGAIGIDDAAIDDGRIEFSGVEQRRDERSRRRLAMRAGDRHALLEAHQFGKHFGTPHDRQAPLAGRHQFGIVALDRGRDHDDLGGTEICRSMADMNLDTLLAKTQDIGIFGLVGTLHPVAEIEKHFGDAGHADAADPDKMNGTEFTRQFH